MFETMRRGWALTKLAMSVVRQDKELLVLPILSGIFFVLTIVGFIGLGFMLERAGSLTDNAALALFLVGYVTVTFLGLYFNTGLVGAAQIRLAGGDPTLKDAFGIANRNLGRIFGWALVAATVGLLLQILERFARERAGFIGQIVVNLIGTAWHLATYFVVPVYITEKMGPFAAVKRSASLFKRTWGETITGGLGIGLVFFVLGLIGLVPLLLGMLSGSALILAVLAGVTVLYWGILVVYHAAASQVLVAALHRFATEGDAGGIMAPQAAQHLFDRGGGWDQYTDPSTGRIRGA